MDKTNKAIVAISIVSAGILIFANKKRSKEMKSKNSNNEVIEQARKDAEVFQTPFEERPVSKRGLTNAEITELTSRFKGMGDAELELFVDLLPVDICMRRIKKELDKAKEFEAAIKSAMSGLK